MKSFVFWLITFAAIGATLGTTLRLGIPEILILWAVLNGLHYGWRSYSRGTGDSPVVTSG